MAAGLMEHSAWLEDASGQMTLAQVRQNPQAFTPYSGVLTRGYTPSTYWLRLRLAPTTQEQLVLRIRPSYLDHIELHDPAAPPTAQVRFSGDRHRKDPTAYQSLNLGFFIAGSTEPRDVYLRLQTSSSMLVYAEVLSTVDAIQADHRQELLYSLYLGLLAAFMAWALLQWLISRELLVGAFLVKQIVVLMHALAIQGYLPLIFGDAVSAPVVDRLSSVLFLAYMAASAAFMLMLLHEFRPARWLWRAVASVLLLYLPLALLFASGRVGLALQLNMVIAMVESIGVLLLALSTPRQPASPAKPERQPSLPRGVLIGFCGALVLAASSSALPSLGGVDGVEWTLNSPMLGGFLISLLMTVLLSLRSSNLEKQRHQMDLDMKLLENQALGERHRREEQERFLAMLTHELKTPLGVARISLGASGLAGPQRTRIDRALANINAIIDRCRFTDEMEHGQLVPKHSPCDLAQLLDDCIKGCSEPERVKVWESQNAQVSSDCDLLAICLANLIDNALKYAPPAADVEVRLASVDASPGQPAGYSLTVRNPVGTAGVPDPERLFTKYYRSPGAHNKSGSGLGLYLTRSLSELVGARLSHRTVDAGDSQGAHVEFRLWIPA